MFHLKWVNTSQVERMSLSKNMGSESNEVNIETSIIKNFKLQAGVSDDANGHFDIIWKYDY